MLKAKQLKISRGIGLNYAFSVDFGFAVGRPRDWDLEGGCSNKKIRTVFGLDFLGMEGSLGAEESKVETELKLSVLGCPRGDRPDAIHHGDT